MASVKQAAAAFLANHRVAVTGVFAVNPNPDTVEGDPCDKDLRSTPGGVQAVVIGTRPELAEDTLHRLMYASHAPKQV
jgi:hypothetical protein